MEILVGSALAVGVLVVALIYFSHDAVVKRAINRAPEYTTEDFPENRTGKVFGELRYLDEPLRSPLTGRPCAYYEIVVEERRSSGKGSKWRNVIHARDGRDFSVDDGHGEAVVRIAGAQIAVVEDRHLRSGTFEEPSDEMVEFLQQHGESAKGWIFNRSLRYTEGVLEAGEVVAVCGRGVREPDPDPARATGGYREQSTLLVLSGAVKLPLYITDDTARLKRGKPS